MNFPLYTAGVSVAVTDASARVQVALTPADRAAADILVDNRGTVDAFVRAGDAAVVADSLAIRVPAGAIMAFSRGDASHVAAVCRAGEVTSLVVHLGQGA